MYRIIPCFSMQDSGCILQLASIFVQYALSISDLFNMKKILSVCVVLIFPLSLFALSYLDYAHILAGEGIIVARATDAEYRVDDPVWRQEVIGMAVNINDDINLNQYSCTGIYNDLTITTPNNWVCRAAEAAAAHGIITK